MLIFNLNPKGPWYFSDEIQFEIIYIIRFTYHKKMSINDNLKICIFHFIDRPKHLKNK